MATCQLTSDLKVREFGSLIRDQPGLCAARNLMRSNTHETTRRTPTARRINYFHQSTEYPQKSPVNGTFRENFSALFCLPNACGSHVVIDE
jgi:hypothetical protein